MTAEITESVLLPPPCPCLPALLVALLGGNCGGSPHIHRLCHAKVLFWMQGWGGWVVPFWLQGGCSGCRGATLEVLDREPQRYSQQWNTSRVHCSWSLIMHLTALLSIKHFFFFFLVTAPRKCNLATIQIHNVASILSPSFNYVSAAAPSPSWRSLRFIISAWHHSNHLVWFKTLMSSLAGLE